jgi:UDP-GlcNAc:undecaprenyl-phosphate GlcNAc-1-phosphate transferase
VISAILAFGIALACVVILTPMVKRLALRVGAVDQPGERRVHEATVPRLGGVALLLAAFAPLVVLFGVETEVARVFLSQPLRILGLVAGGLIVCGLGVIDDLRGVRAWHKLWVQATAATVAFACGYRIEAIAVPGFGHLDMGIFALPMTALWIMAVINAINLIDGLDGLAGGVTFFACITNLVVGAINHDSLVMLLSASLGGAVLGFLLYNFNPASIFMGDSGSMFLGYVLATTAIMGNSVKSSTTVAILVPLIALGLPLMDTLFAMVRRFLERRSIFSPDNGHIHHRLLAMGINHKRAVLTLYGVSILFTAGAILISLGRNWQVGAALLVLSVAMIGVIRAMGNFQVSLRRHRRGERVPDYTVEGLRAVVPDTLQRIAMTRELGELRSVLETFASTTKLACVELDGSQDGQLCPFAWHSPAAGEPASDAKLQLAHANYPLAAAGSPASLRFSWLSEHGDVRPEAEILLQLVVDAVEARLRRGHEPSVVVAKGHLRTA